MTNNQRKTKQGTVISTKMQKTAVVEVERTYPHPVYGKVVRSVKKYYAHDEQSSAKVGDLVQIVETRPLSKSKRWRIVSEKAAD